MNAKNLLKLIEDEFDSIQVNVRLHLKHNGEVEVKSASPADRLIAIAELKRRGFGIFVNYEGSPKKV